MEKNPKKKFQKKFEKFPPEKYVKKIRKKMEKNFGEINPPNPHDSIPRLLACFALKSIPRIGHWP